MMNKLHLLIMAACLCGCVNLHVHFPEASGKPAEAAAPAAQESGQK